MMSKSSSCPAMILLASFTSSLGRLMFLLMKLFGIGRLLRKTVHKEHEEPQRKKLFASLRELCGQFSFFPTRRNATLRLLSDATSGFSVCFAVRADISRVLPASIHAATVCAPTSSIHRKA